MSVEWEAEPYWHDERELGEVFVGGALRPVRARSHIVEALSANNR